MTIRWGVLGCGDVVRRRVAAAIIEQENSQLVAACRRDDDKRRSFCREFGVPRGYATDTELIRDAEVDAVYIATPVNRHHPQTLAAARAGKHVLVEKPMAMTVDECDEMIAVCAEHGVKLGVAYYRRFYPVVSRIQQIIQSGELGEVLSVACTTSAAFRLGPGDDGYWRVIPEQGGGGALMDIGSHRIDLFLSLLGNITEVKSLCDTLAADYASEDCASLIMRFQSGPHGILQCHFGTRVDSDELIVHGTSGQLLSAPLNGGSLRVTTATDQRLEAHPPHANFNSPLVADFVAAIHEDRSPLVSGQVGRQTNRIIEQAYANGHGTAGEGLD